MKCWIVALVCWLLLLDVASIQAGSCSYALSPTSASYSSAAGSGSLTMTVGSGCAWTATTTNSWIHITAGIGTGNGTVSYTVDANLSTSARTGAISAQGKTSVINQAAAPITLGLALDNTNLVWQTGSDYPWYGTSPPAPSYDGTFSAASGNKYVPSSTSWVQTTVVGPGTLSFWWKVDSDVTAPPPGPVYSYDELEFDLNGTMQDQIMGQIDWSYRSYSIPAGTNTLTWQYVKDAQYNSAGDQGWLDRVSYTTNTSIPLYQALNTCGVDWTSGGNSNPTYWTGQSVVAHDGQSGAQSGAVFTSQETWLQAAANGATNVSFWWKVSSQTNFDYLEFYTNSVLARRISGEVDWQSNYFKLSLTTNLLKWRFVRTNAVFVAQGQSCAWLDQVSISPPPKPEVLSYLTNATLSTSAATCQAFLPDLTAAPYLILADNCSSVTVTQAPSAGTLLSVGISHVVLAAFDASGNTTRVTNTVQVVDLTPPVLTLQGANPLTNECHAAFADPGATATDNCSGQVTLTTNSTVNPNGTGVYTIQYVATDANGNAATNTRTVYVVDSQPPVITLNGLNPITVECHSAFTDPGTTAVDACAGGVTAVPSGSVNANSPGTYLLTYTATDGFNTATATRTVNVVDTTPPAILYFRTNVTLSTGSTDCQALLPDLTGTNIVVTDNCSSVTVTQMPPPGMVLSVGTNHVVLTAFDASGNATQVTNTVVVSDQTPPVVTLLGANPLTNECHAAFTDPGATATDNCSGVLTVTTNSTVNPNGAGIYTIQYVATDASGNAATNARTVYVVDSQPPVITLNGLNPIIVECHSGFTDPGASAVDACAGAVTVVPSGSVNANSPGTYLLTYTATDGFNTATVTRTVNVLDTTPPQILQSVPPQTLAAGSNCTAVLPDLTLLLQVTDNCSGVLNRLQDPAAGTTLPLGVTNVLFRIDDGNGNTNTSATLVTVQDLGMPMIASQPQSQTNAVGAPAVFSVSATACSLLTYQWCHESQELAGQTSPSLALSAINSCDAGGYSVVVGTSIGSVTSVVARLTVINQPLNISPGGSLAIGTETECGDLQLGAGSSYVWEVNQALGNPGTNSDLLVVDGAIDLQATAANPFTIRLVSLTASNVAGPLVAFVNTTACCWTLATAGSGIMNFDPHSFALDTSGFGPAYTGTFSVTTNGNSLLVTYSPPVVPPALLGAQKLGSTGFQLSFSGPTGQSFRVLASVDPTAPVGNWSVLTNGVFGPDPVVFIDDKANYRQRFYRIGSP